VVQRPGDTEPIVEPGERPAESGVARRHFPVASLGPFAEHGIELRLRLAPGVDRNGGREGEAVIDGAVDGQELLPSKGESSHLERPFRFGAARGMTLALVDRRVGEHRDVQSDRLFGVPPCVPTNSRHEVNFCMGRSSGPLGRRDAPRF
jgi:hypothetical protein